MKFKVGDKVIVSELGQSIQHILNLKGVGTVIENTSMSAENTVMVKEVPHATYGIWVKYLRLANSQIIKERLGVL